MVTGIIKFPFVITSSDFVKPLWARLECAPTDTPEGLESGVIPKTGTSVYCGRDEFTDRCYVTVSVSNIGLQDDKVRYKLCNNDGSNCGALQEAKITSVGSGSGSGSITLPDLLKGQKYFISNIDEGAILQGLKEGTYRKTYKPWKLYRFVGGAKYEVKDSDCNLDSGLKANIPNGDFVPQLGMAGGEGTKWVNYVYDWAYGPATNIVTYNGQQAYCIAPNLYSIVTLTMSDGSIKKLSPGYSGVKEDGQTINGLGNIVKSDAQCCYGIDANCGSDFKFSGQPGGNSCYSDTQCYNSGGPVPITSTSYVLYECSNSQCVRSDPINVQCTTNTQCPSGKICDLSRSNYGRCIQQQGSGCGDGTCALSETPSTCPTDCTSPKTCDGFSLTHTSNPNWFQKLFGAKDNTTTSCVSLGIIALIVFSIIALALIFGFFKRRKR